MRKSYKLILFVVIALVGVMLCILFFAIKPKAPILSGYSARMACTCHFVQNRSLEDIKSEDLSEAHFNLMRIDIDEADHSVTASTLGFYPKTAIYKKGLGCVLIKDDNDHKTNFIRPSILDTFIWDQKELFNDGQLDDLNELFFGGQGMSSPQMTRAALIIYKDSIIYEAYDKNVTAQTPLLGWSMTKSITGSLIGQLITEGKLSIDQDHLFSEWEDQRSKIKLSDLLHMRSGLDWDEEYGKVSSATKMLFDTEDMVKFGMTLGMEANVGEKFEYSSGTSNLLSGILRTTAQSQNDYLNYPYKYIFKPLGMSSAFIETDEVGTMIGSSFMYASARDWAKYGMLYLNHGKWDNKQVIDSTWVSNTFQSDPVSNGAYGNHFWHNDEGIYPNSPKNLIYASGYQGQRIIILPDEDIVIVRLGLRMMDFDKAISKTINYINQNI
jgi:hypothetical protein